MKGNERNDSLAFCSFQHWLVVLHRTVGRFLLVKTVENLLLLAEVGMTDCYLLSCGIRKVDLL